MKRHNLTNCQYKLLITECRRILESIEKSESDEKSPTYVRKLSPDLHMRLNTVQGRITKLREYGLIDNMVVTQGSIKEIHLTEPGRRVLKILKAYDKVDDVQIRASIEEIIFIEKANKKYCNAVGNLVNKIQDNYSDESLVFNCLVSLDQLIEQCRQDGIVDCYPEILWDFLGEIPSAPFPGNLRGLALKTLEQAIADTRRRVFWPEDKETIFCRLKGLLDDGGPFSSDALHCLKEMRAPNGKVSVVIFDAVLEKMWMILLPTNDEYMKRSGAIREVFTAWSDALTPQLKGRLKQEAEKITWVDNGYYLVDRAKESIKVRLDDTYAKELRKFLMSITA